MPRNFMCIIVKNGNDLLSCSRLQNLDAYVTDNNLDTVTLVLAMTHYFSGSVYCCIVHV